MMSIFAILLVAVLNLIPADVSTFTMVMHETETIRFTKQADGGWNAVELPKDDLGTFYVDGGKLTMKGEGKQSTTDISAVLGVNSETDWQKLTELKLGAVPIQIQRQENGFDFVLTQKNGDSEIKKTFTVRWDTAKDQ